MKVYQLDDEIYLVESSRKYWDYTMYFYHKVNINTCMRSDVFQTRFNKERAKEKCLQADFIIKMNQKAMNWFIKYQLPKAQS